MLKSNWDVLTERIKKLKEEKLGKAGYLHELTHEEELVKDYGIIHASIVMIAYACNQLHFEKNTLASINQLF